MFRQKVKSIAELLPEFLRNQGLETPLLQRRLIDSWETVVGAPIAAYCGEKFIKNQTLFEDLAKIPEYQESSQNSSQRAPLTPDETEGDPFEYPEPVESKAED